MATVLSSPLESSIASQSTSKRTRQTTQLRRLCTRGLDEEIPLLHVDPTVGKASGPHKHKFRTYLRIIARDKVGIFHQNWKQVLEAKKNML